MKVLSSKWIKVTEPFPCVLHVELAREPVNAFSNEFWRAYGALFDTINEEMQDTRAVVLSSALPKIFTVGLDFAAAKKVAQVSEPDAARSSVKLANYIIEFQHAICSVERCPFPVIVAMHGTTVGLGIDIASACDIRYAAANVKLSHKAIDVGFAPDIGMLSFFPKITGNMSFVREMVYTGRSFSAADAERIGFVSKVVDGGRDEVVAAALELAKDIASKTPIGVAGSKKLLTHSRDHTVAQSLDYTAIWNAAKLQTPDMRVEGKLKEGERRTFLPYHQGAKL